MRNDVMRAPWVGPFIETMVLERCRWAMQGKVGRFTQESAHIELRRTADELVATLFLDVLGRHSMRVTTEKDELEVPASWWDHFKERFAPQWLYAWWQALLLRPLVRYRTYKRTRRESHYYRICPHMNCSAKHEHVQYLAMPFAKAKPVEQL